MGSTDFKILTFCLIWYTLITMFTMVTDLDTGIFIAESTTPTHDLSGIGGLFSSILGFFGTIINILFFSTNIMILDVILWTLRIISLIEIIIIVRSFFYV